MTYSLRHAGHKFELVQGVHLVDVSGLPALWVTGNRLLVGAFFK
jgi:hypothetical protein